MRGSNTFATDGTTPVLVYGGETGRERNLTIFQDKPINTHNHEKISTRALLIDMVIHRDILTNNQMPLFAYV